MIAIGITGILFSWFLMTAVVQLPARGAQAIRHYDPTGNLLPGWHFFSPKPVQADFAVYYRSWEVSGSGQHGVGEDAAGQWYELAGLADRRIADAVVNPGRYARKSIFICCDQIAATLRAVNGQSGSAGFPPPAVLLSLPYLLLAEKVSSICPDAVAVQFRIDVILYAGDSSMPAPLFCSAVHRVNARKDQQVAAR
jgi:hypothetical protein